MILFFAGRQVDLWCKPHKYPPRFANNLTPVCLEKGKKELFLFLFGDYVYDYVQGVSWIRDPQRLYRIKSCYCSSSTGFKSVSYSFPDCIFDYFDVAFGFSVC